MSNSPPPVAAPQFPPPSDQVDGPSTLGYWISGGVVVLGIVGAIAFFVIGLSGISDTVGGFERVDSGTGTIDIESTGGYVIYTEDQSSAPEIEVISPDGEPVSTRSYTGNLEYSVDERSGLAVQTFDADDTGEYTITTDADLAIGESVGDDLVRTIALPFAIAAIGALIGLVVLITTVIRRSNAKNRVAAIR